MYASQIWNPSKKGSFYKLEKVQNIFLRYLGTKFGIPYNYFEHKYSRIKNEFKILFLESSRIQSDLF